MVPLQRLPVASSPLRQTALLTAMPHPRLCPSAALGNARQWDRALDIVRRMRRHGFGGGLEPNAYTYSGEQAGCLAALLPCCLLI